MISQSQSLDTLKKKFSTLYGLPHLCPVCGNIKQVTTAKAICDDLAKDWRLTSEQRRFFDYREGCACASCGSSVRRMHMGMALLEVVNLGYGEQVQFVKDLAASSCAASLQLAEINNCGQLHGFLAELPHLAYSEYGSEAPGIPSEDLRKLSYADNTFDIVLTSDVLEHVPEYQDALLEVRRVLKPGGVFVFTVPMLPDRQTVIRARLGKGGGVEHLLPPSFHGQYSLAMEDYLVFYEFGYDFVTELEKLFVVSLYAWGGFGGIIGSVFVCNKEPKGGAE